MKKYLVTALAITTILAFGAGPVYADDIDAPADEPVSAVEGSDEVTADGDWGDEVTEGYYKGEINEDNSTVTLTGLTDTAPATLELNIPATIQGHQVTAIGSLAFYGKSGLTGNINIPNGVKEIGGSAFEGCTGLRGTLSIPNSVISIGSNAFADCAGLTGTLSIPTSVTSIGSSAFENCRSLSGDLTIPNSITSIADSLFYGCSGFKGKISIPGSVTSIGEWAFKDCSGLTGDLTIPNSVTFIDYGAFGGCSGLEGILTIPNSVTLVGNYAFGGCSKIGKIINNSTSEIEASDFLNNYDDYFLSSNGIVIGYDDKIGTGVFTRNGTTGVQSVALDKHNIMIPHGTTVTLVATVSPADAPNKAVSWTSDNPAVAAVSNTGVVTAVSAGNATITVTTVENNKRDTCYVTVTGVNVQSVALDRTSANLTVGATLPLVATITPANADNKGVTWTSSAPAIASVSNTGLVTALSPGTATITVTTADGGKTAACTITVTRTNIGGATIEGIADATYTGKPITPTPKVTLNGRVLVAGTDYTVAYSNNINAGTATVNITGAGAYEGTISKTFKIKKAAVKISANKISLKVSAVKKKKQTIKAKKAFSISKDSGKVTYKKTKGNNGITVSKSGAVTVKKGLKKGTYNVKVKISVAGNKNYKKTTKTVTLKITIKK